MHKLRPASRGARSLLTFAGAAVTVGLSAQTAPAPAAAPTVPATEEEVVVLSPFEVTADSQNGYTATDTLAGTRIRTDLRDVGSSISVVTKEFLKDVGATNNATLLQYTTNTEVSGTLGTYSGLGTNQTLSETSTLRGSGANQRVRGLASADNTRDFFTTDIPWDSFNVERIDIQRGPNSILFGLGSPAGIVNATVNNAGFKNKGEVQFRYGSYGSERGSLDYNQVLIDNVLAIRVDGLLDNKKFQQDPAYEDDHRFSVALRFDPKLIKANGFNTSFKVKYEAGEIEANRPRTLPPYDSITPWFRAVDRSATTNLFSATSGLGKTGVNYAADIGSDASNVQPWIGQNNINQQQPAWFIDGQTNQLYKIYGGFVNRGARKTNGDAQGSSASLNGQRYGEEFPAIVGMAQYAINAQLPGWENGQYRDISLTDSSVFDFYNTLIDGDTKSEFANWYAYNIDFSQTGWDDRVGVQASYDKQHYIRGGQALISNPTLNVDILRNFADNPNVAPTAAASNPNYGRSYVQGGPGGGSSYQSDRESFRASLFGELRAADLFGKGTFLTKLLGRQRLNGVFATETYQTENRGWQMYANSQEWAGYYNQNAGNTSSFTDRAPVAVIYLGAASTLANSATGQGVDVPGINSDVQITPGSVYHFSSTWNAASTVGYATPWTVPSSLTRLLDPLNAGTNFEASNPANYVGWNSNFTDNVIAYNNGENLSLTTQAALSRRQVKSYAGTWQGYLWNEAIVPTLGWRFDSVRTKGYTAGGVSSNRSILNLNPDVYKLPATYPANSYFKDHSTAGGVVVHLNKLFVKDPLPFNISLSYNKSNNFQVMDTRRSFFGNVLGNPSGDTKEYGVLLATKDGKYSLRVVKYETNGYAVSSDTDLGGLNTFIMRGISFRNVLLYKLSNYPWATREALQNGHGNRQIWYPGYVDNTTGKYVSDYDPARPDLTPQPANSTLETDAQAAARRDAAIRSWNASQIWLEGKGYFTAWKWNATTSSALTDRATLESTGVLGADGKYTYAAQYTPDPASVAQYGATPVQGLTMTSDTQSKGYELEFTANPTQSLRLSLNAAKTTASRSNVGSAELDEIVSYFDTAMSGPGGELRQYNGAFSRGNTLGFVYAAWRGKYALAKLQDGAATSELRKWRVNLVANYTINNGAFKGVNFGGGYRWQAKNVIGYPMVYAAGSNYGSYDLTKPFYGPSEKAIDLWVGYQHKLTEKIDWRIQLNVRNVGDKEGLIPTTVEPDGVTVAACRIAPVQEWSITNTFSF